jgi:NAD(P)-dependent dehydrogenase (short-subunit alcohol dehydrogenase family)
LESADPGEVDTVFAINVHGVINGCSVAVEGMGAQPGGGWIWNMEGLGSGGQIQPGVAVYGASKRAVTYLTEALIKEQKGTDVKIGFLSPGIVVTDLLVGDYAGDPEGFAKARRIFNILGDRVETVTPYLVDGLLKASKSGTRVAWLTTTKAATRFLTAGFKKRDLFAESA